MSKTIYTANFNNYDSFKEPKVVTPGWEYVYYTNNKEYKSDVWKVVYIDTKDPKECRRLKILNPHKDDDISIWHDSSMEINCNLDEFVEKYCPSSLNLMNHPHRICVYKEAEECIKRKKDNSDTINEQMRLYKHKGYPMNNGMVATGIIVRKKSEGVTNFCKDWWEQVRQYSKRDQLSFNFVYRGHKVPYQLFPFEVLQKEFLLQKHIK